MSIKDLEEALQLIEENIDKCDFEKEPKSEGLIQLAEKALGLKFPETYRLFLKQYGCGILRGTEIYGVLHENFEASGIPDGIWLTLDERKVANLPLHFIIISDTGDGYWYCLDTSQTNDQGECPVVIWGLGIPEKNKEKVNEDFGAFLLERTKRALED